MHKHQWIDFRNALLDLHKALLELERKTYEGQHGKVASPGAVLKLVMEHPSFAWLRQISELVVGIDELLDGKQEAGQQKYADMLAYCKQLLKPKIDGSNFERNYYHAIHKDPAVALAHAKTQSELKKISE